MTSSKFTNSDGGAAAKSSELPELQRPQHDAEVDDDDEGFQTVVSKRTVKLMQLQQQQQARQNNRRGYNNGYGHHGYGNGNGRHYHRQYGPPHSSSSGTNSNSSASSIPDDLPKDRDLDARHDDNQIAESTTPTPRPQPITLVSPTTPSPPVMAWARIAAGEKPPKLDVPQNPGKTDISSSNSPVSTFDVKPLAISLVASTCEGIHDEITPVKASSGTKTNSVPQIPKQTQQAHDQNQTDSESVPVSPRPQIETFIIPPPPPSIWKMRAAALSGGQTKSDVAQSSGPTNSASSVVAGTTKGKVPPSSDSWPSLDFAVKPTVRPAEVSNVSFTTPQTGGTTPSESATDSGNEEILRITGPPELSDEKWPLPLLSNGVGKGQPRASDPSVSIGEKLRQSRHGSGDAMSSSGCDQGGNGDTQDGDSNETKKKKKKKASKQKWVPLILEDEPPKPPPKPKKRKEKFEQPRGIISQQNNGAAGGDASSESTTATPTEGIPRPSRGLSSSRGGSGRNGHKGRKHQNYYKFYKETSDPSQLPDANGAGYEDYSTDFSTMNPLYPPLTEFVMPYTSYATYSPPPDAQAYSYVPIPIDDAVLTQLIQKQIEYYFSEENLAKDFYLRRKMDSEGYIPISLITSFFRIQSMTQDYNVVLNAIKASELIEVKEEEESCALARPVESPSRWPIVDTAAASIPPPPAIVKSFLTSVTTATTSQ